LDLSELSGESQCLALAKKDAQYQRFCAGFVQAANQLRAGEQIRPLACPNAEPFGSTEIWIVKSSPELVLSSKSTSSAHHHYPVSDIIELEHRS
jgi:hypothetical protein